MRFARPDRACCAPLICDASLGYYERRFMTIKMILTISILLFATKAIALGESNIPFDAARDRYWNMLVSEKYKQLEHESKSAREDLAPLADGQPRLAAFYAGVSGCLTSGCRNTLSSADWKLRFEKLKKWVASDPNSNTAKIALATYDLEYGWAARGQGPVDTVTPLAMAIFREYVDRARVRLIGLENIGKSDPGWYTSLLRVARSQGWPRKDFIALYGEALNKFPGYIPIYYEMATYLAPRWYGSIPELRSYIDEVTKNTYSTMGGTLYTRLNWLMSTDNMFQNGQASWGRMRMGFERIIKDYPDPWNINNYAMFACLAGDSETFAKLNKTINGDPIIAAFWGSRQNYDICVSRISDGKLNTNK